MDSVDKGDEEDIDVDTSIGLASGIEEDDKICPQTSKYGNKGEDVKTSIEMDSVDKGDDEDIDVDTSIGLAYGIEEDHKICLQTSKNGNKDVDEKISIEMNSVDNEGDMIYPPTPFSSDEDIGVGASIGLASGIEEDHKICPQTAKNGSKVVDEKKSKDHNLNITSEITVDLTKTDQTEINNILRMVCACLNSRDGSKLILINKSHKTAKTKDFDNWYNRIETNMRQKFFDLVSKYIGIEGNCNSEKIIIDVKQRAPYLCSMETYLYFTSVSAVEEVSSREAIDILKTSGKVAKAEDVEIKNCRMFEILRDFRNENDNLQFKAITGNRVPTRMSDMCSKYLSGFFNNRGGVILFGVEDSTGKVVGVTTHKEKDIKELENKIKEKFASLKFGSYDGKIEKGFHWDIDYIPIHMDGEFYMVEKDETFLKYKKEQTLQLLEQQNSNQWWLFKDFDGCTGLARADCFVEDQKTWYTVSGKNGDFKQDDTITIIGIEEEHIYKCKSGKGHFGKIHSSFLKIDKSKRYTSKCDGSGKKPYFIGEKLKLVSKDNAEWWTFETISGDVKQLPASIVKALNSETDEGCDGQEHQKEHSEKTQLIVLRVGSIHGGVFTAEPISCYADNKGKVHRYTLDEWISKTKSEKGTTDDLQLQYVAHPKLEEITSPQDHTEKSCIDVERKEKSNKLFEARKYETET